MRRLLILALVVAGALDACTLPRGHASAPLPTGTGTIVRPIDGDTVVIAIGGVDEHVRLLGIDTPESVARNRPIECYGPEAKERTAELLPVGTVVRLERDVEARDRYDRLLAYVIRDEDDVLINVLLVQEGYAAAFPFAPNDAHEDEIARAEAEAKAAGRGLWPVCGGIDTPIGPPPG